MTSAAEAGRTERAETTITADPTTESRATPTSHLSWIFVACAVVAVALVLTTGSLPAPAWRWAVVALGVVAVVAARRRPVPMPFVAGVALMALRVATRPEHRDGIPGRWQLATDVAGGVLVCLLLFLAIQYRKGRLGARDLLDLIAVVIGTGVIAWLAVAHPLIESGAGVGSTLLFAVYLPMTSLLVVFTIDLGGRDLRHNRTLWLATSAAVVHLGAMWLCALLTAGHLEAISAELPMVGNVVAGCLFAAALLHPDAPAAIAPMRAAHLGPDTVTRIAVMGLCVLVPVSAIAAVAPSSTDDVIVRTTGIALLVVAVVVRLVIATRESRDARDTLLRQVMLDDLTKLPTRSRFLEDVAEILEATWHTQHRAALVRLNLDRFKNINDTFGHFAANEVIVVIADRLRVVAEEIGAEVARVGGDDFALVQGTTADVDEALRHAEAVRTALAAPVTVGDSSVFVTASIGVSFAPRNRTTAAEDLMRHADIAAHRAKQNGRNRIEVFDESMHSNLARRMDVEHALHGAIGRREMLMHHQPIVDIVTGRISGFEALMRWQRQDGTLVSPLDFIPIAEETGIICELGAWALHDALTSLRQWIDSGVVPPTATMSVNVSPRQIADPKFPTIVADVLADTRVPPRLLWLEITESMMLDEPELAARTLEEIRAMGVRIALDDFGTGYSSLSLLQGFPIQRIKIDRSFVSRLGDQGTERSLVRTIIAMAHSMSLDLVAEGVETVEQLEALRELGCDKAQGFLVSRPVPAEAMRSTMVALEELASLSLFDRPDVASEPTPTPVATSPVYAGSSSYGGPVSPMGPMATRPLGGPML